MWAGKTAGVLCSSLSLPSEWMKRDDGLVYEMEDARHPDDTTKEIRIVVPPAGTTSTKRYFLCSPSGAMCHPPSAAWMALQAAATTRYPSSLIAISDRHQPLGSAVVWLQICMSANLQDQCAEFPGVWVRDQEADEQMPQADDEVLAVMEQECMRLRAHKRHLHAALDATHEKVSTQSAA